MTTTICVICSQTKHTYKCQKCVFECCLSCFTELEGEQCPLCRQGLQLVDGNDLVQKGKKEKEKEGTIIDPVFKKTLSGQIISKYNFRFQESDNIRTQMTGAELKSIWSGLNNYLDDTLTYWVEGVTGDITEKSILK